MAVQPPTQLDVGKGMLQLTTKVRVARVILLLLLHPWMVPADTKYTQLSQPPCVVVVRNSVCVCVW